MSITVKLKHSATANKVPLSTDLAEGELALNINAASPAAYLKDSAGVVRKIAGITVGGTAPATPTAGMAWLDVTVPTKPVFKVHDGTAWQGAGSGTSTGATMPTAPAAGDLWVDTTVPTAPVLKVHNGTAFVALAPDASETVKGIVELATAAETTTGTDATRAVHPAGLKVELDKKAPKTTTSDTAPANPKDGDLWYDSVGGELYVWYDSDDAGAVAGTWVQANPQVTPKTATATAAGVDVKLWKKTGTTLETETAGDKVATAALPPGSVLQVVNGTYSTSVTNSTNVYADTGLTATITPSSASSKILVVINQNGVGKTAGQSGTSCTIQLLRGATVISLFGKSNAYTNSSMENRVGSVSACVLDSPATTSAVTYKTQFNSPANFASALVQDDSSISTITLMEIAA